MSKTLYFFMSDTPSAPSTTPILPDVYCPVGGYKDKGLDKEFSSKGEKYRYLKSKGMREAEPINPNQMLGGTEGRSLKQRGDRGNFKSRPMPSWMKQELSKLAGQP